MAIGSVAFLSHQSQASTPSTSTLMISADSISVQIRMSRMKNLSLMCGGILVTGKVGDVDS